LRGARTRRKGEGRNAAKRGERWRTGREQRKGGKEYGREQGGEGVRSGRKWRAGSEGRGGRKTREERGSEQSVEYTGNGTE